jgi:formylglycine-generating enzyme
VRALAVGIILGALGVAVGLAISLRGKGEGARCGHGFEAHGARCLVRTPCPSPLVATTQGCDAPDVRILVPATVIALGPSDWEVEGRIAARTIRVPSFRIDAFEVTRGRWALFVGKTADDGDPACAACAMTRSEAAAFCAGQGGRLPTEDEWIAAAASGTTPPRRYPWGETGAVCRRAAWGLATGPCAASGVGPDTVGAHPDGDTPLGMHDLAGNVAEWVATEGQGPAGRPAVGIVKGGSWQSALAADLRIWARLELDASERDRRVGFRCAYSSE